MVGNLVNLEVEQALLGAILANNTSLAHVGKLGPQHFADTLHARIFEAAADMIRTGKFASPLTLASAFATDTTLQDIGGIAYLGRLAALAGPAVGVRTYAGDICDLADRRTVTAVANNLVAEASDGGSKDFREKLAMGIANMTSIFDGSRERQTQFALATAATDVLDRLDRMRAGETDRNAIPTGFNCLDRMTGGMRRGELIIWGGRPSMGKTALCTQLMTNVSRAGFGVAFFSLEMPVAQITPRFLSGHVWGPGGPNIPYQRILQGAVSADEARWLRSAAADFKTWPLTIDDDAGLTAVEIEARCRVIASRLQTQGKSLDLVVVDHIHKMRHPGASSRVAEYSVISAGLAEAAKRLDCPLLALAQLNRGVEGRDDKRPSLADLRESGAIEQDADTVAFLYRAGYYLERHRCRDPQAESDRLADLDAVVNKLELIIAKQRSGPIGTVDLWADMPSNVVLDPGQVHRLENAA